MTRTVYLSGEFVPEEDAKISIFDSAVSLGDTVTDSVRTFGHRPFKLEEHVQRLYKSLKVARIDPGCEPAELLAITEQVLEKNLPLLAPHEDYWLVYNISRGMFVMGPDPTVQCGGATVMIFNQPLDLRGWASYYEHGCHAVTAMSRAVPSQSLDARIKNRSRMAYTLAEMEVKLVDPDAQGVLLDVDGNVAENKGGNIFVVADGVVKTPICSNSLAGISRETILELCQEESITCQETLLQPYDLYTADEVFFTSTPYCMMPATRFNGLPIGDGQVGAITRQLLAAWSNRVGVDIAKQATAQISP
jgi:branched-chain amino acid aminotransferase